MIWHSSSLNEINEELQTNFEKGLSDAIANYRLKDFNENFSSTVSVIPFYKRLLIGFKQPMSVLLLVAAAIFYFIELIMPSFDKAHLNIAIGVILFLILFIFIKTLISYICEIIIAKEQKTIAPKAVVIRGGVEKTINSTEVVPGDLIVLRRRYSIPADARLIKSENLICNESAITGKNVPVVKDCNFDCTDITPLDERANMVYSGCWVSHGYGLAIVTETGDETEFGKQLAIVRKPALSDIDDSLINLRKLLSQISVYLFVVLFVLTSIITRFTDIGSNLTLLSICAHTLLISSAISILLSPVSISEISSLTTAIGLVRLKKQKVSVTNAEVIDEMGNVNCVCVDKSAITEHEMTATEIYNGVDFINITSGVSNDTAMLLRLAAAASIDDGDTTDRALISACETHTNTTKTDIDNLYPQLTYVPFDHDTMTTVSVNMIDGQPYAIVKGAAEKIAEFCTGDTQRIIDSADAMGTRALHVIAVAVKVLSSVSDTVNPSKEELYGGLTFLGLVGFLDPIKAGTRSSVIECLDSNIDVKLFTGDSLATAKAIARQAGILNDDQQACLGCELENLSDDDLLEYVKSHSVFARINPNLRNRIIQLMTASGYTLAATGRSPRVNAAMDSANISCALGSSSSDAVKRTADVVLNDDSFKSIVSMIKSGRNIYNNIRNSIGSLFTINIALIIFEVFGYFIWQTTLLNSIQMLISVLLVDLVTIMIIAFEPYAKLKTNTNRYANRISITYKQKINVAWQSVVIATVTLFAYGVANKINVDAANIACLLVFISASIISVLSYRTENSIIGAELFSNKVCLAVTLVVYIMCFVLISGSAKISLSSVMPVLVILSLIPLFLMELVKIIKLFKRSK